MCSLAVTDLGHDCLRRIADFVGLPNAMAHVCCSTWMALGYRNLLLDDNGVGSMLANPLACATVRRVSLRVKDPCMAIKQLIKEAPQLMDIVTFSPPIAYIARSYL